jgi:PadR family transcriptional regulator, regulatory protein PadR
MREEEAFSSAQLLKGLLDLLLLATVREEPAHGYAIIERLRLHSGGTFDLPEGMIYPALLRLEQAGLLASRWSEAPAPGRRIYRLTRRGQAELQHGRTTCPPSTRTTPGFPAFPTVSPYANRTEVV